MRSGDRNFQFLKHDLRLNKSEPVLAADFGNGCLACHAVNVISKGDQQQVPNSLFSRSRAGKPGERGVSDKCDRNPAGARGSSHVHYSSRSSRTGDDGVEGSSSPEAREG